MKVQVIVKNSNKAATTNTTVDAVVRSTDKVLNVKEFVASTANVAFPDQALVFKGKVLLDTQSLSECGINDGDMLELLVQASEDILVKQVSDLLGEKGMTPAELSLLYSYRHGASLEDAFKALGYGNGQISVFLENHKHFSCQGGLVKIAKKSALQPCAPKVEEKPASLIEVSVCIDLQTLGEPIGAVSWDEDEDVHVRLQVSQTVAEAMDMIAGVAQMPFPDRDLILGGKALDRHLSLDEAGVKNGSALVMAVRASKNSLAAQLEQVLQQRGILSPSDLGLHYCQQYGTPIVQALRALGLKANLRDFIESQNQFSIAGGCVTLKYHTSFTPMEGPCTAMGVPLLSCPCLRQQPIAVA